MRGWLSPGTHSSKNSTNYPVLFGKSSFFFFKVRRLDQQKEEDPMEGGSPEPRGAITSGGLQLAGAQEVCSWRRPTD